MARKSVSKRIRMTKNGKLMRRKMAQDHFRAKKRGVQLHRKRVSKTIHRADVKMISKYLTTNR